MLVSHEGSAQFVVNAYFIGLQELKDITESLKSKPGFECSEGEKDVNRRKNRYKDILPCEY